MKEKTKAFTKRYTFFLVMLAANAVLLIVQPALGFQSMKLTGSNLLDMLSVIPPIFVLLGLLDVWVKRETMIRFMGEGSGLVGILIAFVMGSVAAGPLYASFPVAVVLLKKGSRLFNVLVFVGAWSTTKIPLLLFEATSLGGTFMLTRFLLDIPGILLIAWATEKLVGRKMRAEIESKAA